MGWLQTIESMAITGAFAGLGMIGTPALSMALGAAAGTFTSKVIEGKNLSDSMTSGAISGVLGGLAGGLLGGGAGQTAAATVVGTIKNFLFSRAPAQTLKGPLLATLGAAGGVFSMPHDRGISRIPVKPIYTWNSLDS
ncbi:hypothetical protein [Nocardia sp. NPDC004722]